MLNRIFLLVAFTTIIVTTTFAQSTPIFQQDVEDLVLAESNTLVYSPKSIAYADFLMNEVTYGTDASFDSAIYAYDTSPFIAADAYVSTSSEAIIMDMVKNVDANFRAADVDKVSIVIRTDGKKYLVVVTALR